MYEMGWKQRGYDVLVAENFIAARSIFWLPKRGCWLSLFVEWRMQFADEILPWRLEGIICWL